MSPANTKYNVFLSSTWIDLQTERNAVIDLTQRLTGLQFLGMEFFGTRDANVAHASLDEVDKCDIYLGVIGGRYGSGITELEYARAIERRIPCLIYIKNIDPQLHMTDGENPEARQRLQALLDRLRRAHTCSEFRGAEDLAVKISVDLHNWLLEKQLTNGLAKISADFVSRVQGFVFEYLGGEHHHVPFGGRNPELKRLNSWLTDNNAPSRLLVTAGAGRGKSALLVRWAQSLASNASVATVFFPVSIRFRTNMASITFTSLAAYLAAMHGESLIYDPNATTEIWRGRIADYLARSLSDQRLLVIIIDGLDEAADWEAGPDLFPYYLSPHIRIVVSARPLAGDKGPEDWLRRLGWDGFNHAETIELSQLTEAGVADVLTSLGFPLADLAEREEIVQELHRLSEGDPLLIRLYVDDLLGRNVATKLQIADLRNIKPGLEGFFLRWWDDQRRLWGQRFPLREKAVQTVMNLLACGLGPLYRDDILALAEPSDELNTWTLEGALEPLRRFIVGDGVNHGYVYGHPRLGIHFRERLSQMERAAVENRFLDWCREQVSAAEMANDDQSMLSSYTIQYFGAHLERLNAALSSFAPLLSNVWRKAWFAHEGAHSSYQADLLRVQSAILKSEKASQSQSARARAEFFALGVRCALCLASVSQISKNTPFELVVPLVDRSIWPRHGALAYARLIDHPIRRAEALISLAALEDGAIRQQILDDVFETIDSLNIGYRYDEDLENTKVHLLQKMQPLLSDTHLAAALCIVLSLASQRLMVKALREFVAILPLAEVDRVILVVQKLADIGSRLELLSEIAEFHPISVLDAIMNRSDMLEDYEKVSLLVAASDQLDAELRDRALNHALQILKQQIAFLGEDNPIGLNQLLDISARLSRAECSELLQQAITGVESVSSLRAKVALIARIAARVDAAEKNRMVQNALSHLQRMNNPYWIASCLSELAPLLDENQLAIAVQLIEESDDDSSKAVAVPALFPHLNERQRESAIAMLAEMTDPLEKLSVLAKIYGLLPAMVLNNLIRPIFSEIERWPLDICCQFSALAMQVANEDFWDIVVSAVADYSDYHYSHYYDESNLLMLATAIAVYAPAALRPSLNSIVFKNLSGIWSGGDDLTETLCFWDRWGSLLSDAERETVLLNILRWKPREKGSRYALAGLAPYLSGSQLQQVLLVFQNIGDSYQCDWFLAECFTHLDPECVLESHQDAWALLNSAGRCRVIESWMGTEGTLRLQRRHDMLSIIKHDGNASSQPAKLVSAYLRYFHGSIDNVDIRALIELKIREDAEKQNVLAVLIAELPPEQLQPYLPDLFRASLHHSEEAVRLTMRIAQMLTPEFVYQSFVGVCEQQFSQPKDEDEYPRFPLLLALIGILELDQDGVLTNSAAYVWQTVVNMPDADRVWLIDDISKRFDGVGETLFQRLVAMVAEMTDEQLRIKTALRLLPRLREPVLSNFMPKVMAWLADLAEKPSVKVQDYFSGPLVQPAVNASAWQAAVVLHCLPRLGRETSSDMLKSAYRELRQVLKNENAGQILLAFFPIASEELRQEMVVAFEEYAHIELSKTEDLQAKLEVLIMLLPYFSARIVKRVLKHTLARIKIHRDYFRENHLVYMSDPEKVVVHHFLTCLAKHFPQRIGKILLQNLSSDYFTKATNPVQPSASKQILNAGDSSTNFEIIRIFEAAQKSREEVLQAIRFNLATISELGGQLAVERIVNAVTDVRKWWP